MQGLLFVIGRISIALIFNLFVINKLAYTEAYVPYVPPPLPLSPFPVVDGEQLREYAQEVVSVLGEATLPTRPDEVLAIILSETVAGVTGGISERVAAYLVGDEKSLGAVITGTTAGTYFGVRSAINSVALALGLPPSIARLVAGITASFAAEVLKIAERNYEEQKGEALLIESTSQAKSVESENLSALKSKSMQPLSPLPSFRGVDVVQDVTKWVAYDLLLPTQFADINVPIPVAAQYGCISALFAHFVYELLVLRESQKAVESNIAASAPENAKQKPLFARFIQAAIEGAVLFAVYEGSINFFEITATPELKRFLTWEFASFSLLHQESGLSLF